MSGRSRRRRRFSGWSVRTRILTAMLAVAALGMTAAGVTAYLVQRDRIMHEVDEHLLHS